MNNAPLLPAQAGPASRPSRQSASPSPFASKLLCSLAASAAMVLALCAHEARAADEIVIGTSIPLSGPLAGFGSFQKWGYNHAVEEVNKAGGIAVGGKKYQIKLVIRDDKTDPNVSSGNIETLISRDHAVALLGSCTPALVNAGALVAERHKVPMVTGCDPLEAFKSVRAWTYVWDIFFDEPEIAAAAFKSITELNGQGNKKIAIMADNGPDGQIVGGQIWPALAKQFGYEVVVNASFPVDTSQFTSVIAQAKSANAEIVLVDSITPPGVSLRKQMKEGGFTPKVMVNEKGAEPVQYAQALGKLSDGVLVGGYWDPTFPYPGAADLEKQFEKETGLSGSQHIADSYAAAQVLFDAIKAAASTDAAKINDAISRTDKTYVVGPIKFDAAHTSKLPIVELQWQGGKTVIVWPKDRATGKFLYPITE